MNSFLHFLIFEVIATNTSSSITVFQSGTPSSLWKDTLWDVTPCT